jgi:hypothetical protein
MQPRKIKDNIRVTLYFCDHKFSIPVLSHQVFTKYYALIQVIFRFLM